MWIQLKKAWNSQPEGSVLKIENDAVADALVKAEVAVITADPTASTINGFMSKACEDLAQSFQAQLNAVLKSLPPLQLPEIKGTFNKSSLDKPNFGEFCIAVKTRNEEFLTKSYEYRQGQNGKPIYKADQDEGYVGKASLNTQIGTQGGYLVPTVFYPQLMKIASERSIVRSRATVIPMASRSVQLPTLDITTAPSAGDTAFFGGLVARWTEEAASIPQTEPVFKQLELVAHELSGHTKASNVLLADNAIALESFLIQLFGSAIAWFEDYAFLRGNGVGKPLGVTEAGAAVSVTRNTASQFKLVDASKMLAKMLPGWNPASTTWCVSPSVLEYLIQISDSAGNVIWIPNAREGLPMTLFGIPVAVTEKLPALGTAKDVLLVDFQHYLIGDRMQLEIAYSEHVGFLTNQGTWRFTHRVDGQPWIRSAITLSDASSTVSPFIYLT